MGRDCRDPLREVKARRFLRERTEAIVHRLQERVGGPRVSAFEGMERTGEILVGHPAHPPYTPCTVCGDSSRGE